MNSRSVLSESQPASEIEPTLESSVNEPVVDDSSRPFVGTWHKLVSSTNWEKGRIISNWREAQMAAGLEASAYSDEAWAQVVGDVTSQHVGRLRRVYDRFGVVQTEYPGLYWSHFHAALDWQDAEIWLEGAVQQKWSIAAMRRQRDQAHSGDNPADGPSEIISERVGRDTATSDDPDIITGELTAVEGDLPAEQSGGTNGEVSGDGPEFDTDSPEPSPTKDSTPKTRPFANLPQLPDDLADAFESFKLAILHHKLTGWQEIGLPQVLASLDALKQLAEAPSE